MERTTYDRQRVYDAWLRILHARIGLTVLFLVATAWTAEAFEQRPEEATVWRIHATAGFGLIVGLVARLVWGLVGPASARWTDLVRWRDWLAMLRDRSFGGVTRFGHHPLASAAYVALYGVLAMMGMTGIGLAAIEHDLGPLATQLYDSVWLEGFLEGPHEVGALAVVGFVVLHLAAIVWHERRDGVPIAQAMISGYQYRRVDASPPKEVHDAK